MSVNQQLAQVAEPLIAKYMNQYDAIEVISLATTDGFAVLSSANTTLHIDEDKMAAASSTLYSVSNAVAKQILNKSFKITYIEAEQGNVVFISLPLKEFDFVLAMSANETMNVGQLRVLINRLASELVSAY